MLKSPYLCALLASASLLGLASGAHAEAAAAADKPTAQVEELIVTAERREERLQDVPLAVSVVSGDQLRKSNFTQITDLQFLSPGVNYNANFGGGFNVRGVGTQSLLMTAEQSVAVVIDDIIQGLPEVSFAGPSYQSLTDVERVEVLKGPQGTLFGKNSSAGVLQIVTKRPELGVLAGDGSLSYGTGNETKFSANMNIPLGQTLAARISAYQERRDGFIENRYDHNKLWAYNRYGLRGKLLWKPNDKLTVYAIGEYRHSYDNGNGIWTLRSCGSGFLSFSPCAELAKYGVTAGPKNLAGAWEGPIYNKEQSTSGTLRIDYDLGGATLTSITGYRDLRTPIAVDTDSTPRPILTRNESVSGGTEFTQELRLTGKVSIFDYTAGAFYYDAKPFQTNLFAGTLTFVPDTSPILLSNNNIGPYSGSGGRANLHAETKSAAVFGQVAANVTDQFQVIGGLRYTKDDVSQEYFATPVAGVCRIAYFAGGSCNSIPLPSPHVLTKTSADNVSGKVTLKYKFSDDVNVYASYATGYKGPMIANPAGRPQQVLSPETSTSYEAGVKAVLFDRRVAVNLDAFRVEYKNFQGQTRVIDPGPPPVYYYTTQNAGGLQTQGVEGDVTFRATPELTLMANFAYQPTKFKEFSIQCFDGFTNPGTPVGQCNYVKPGMPAGSPPEFNAAGYPLIYSPKVTYAVAADWEHPLSNGMSVNAHLNWTWRDKSYGIVADPNSIIDAYGLLGGQIGYGREDGRWRVSVWGRNLLDRYFVAGVFRTPLDTGSANSTPRSTLGYSNIPAIDASRTIGVKLDVKFGE